MKTPKAAIRAAVLGMMMGCVALATTGCWINQRSLGKTPLRPPYGLIYTDFKAPLDFEGLSKNGGTPNEGLKVGNSEVMYIGLPYYDVISASWGDASIETSQKAGNIEKLEFADYEYFTVLGVYSKFTVHAYGK